MEGLSDKIKLRLEKWTQSLIKVNPVDKIKTALIKTKPKHGGKFDYGDVSSLEELEDEARRSQTYRR